MSEYVGCALTRGVTRLFSVNVSITLDRNH